MNKEKTSTGLRRGRRLCALLLCGAALLSGCGQKGIPESTRAPEQNPEPEPLEVVLPPATARQYLENFEYEAKRSSGLGFYSAGTGALEGLEYLRLADLDGNGLQDLLCYDCGTGRVLAFQTAEDGDRICYIDSGDAVAYALGRRDGQGWLLSFAGDGSCIASRLAPLEEKPDWEAVFQCREDDAQELDVLLDGMELEAFQTGRELPFPRWLLDQAGVPAAEDLLEASRRTRETLNILCGTAEKLPYGFRWLERHAYDSLDALDQKHREALRMAALRCHYAYFFDGPQALEGDALPGALACLTIYTPSSSLGWETLDNSGQTNPDEPFGRFYVVNRERFAGFLKDTFMPAFLAWQKASAGPLPEAWHWAERDEKLYVNVFGYTATLIYGEPACTSLEPLGGDRYLACFRVKGDFCDYQLAAVLEDLACENEEPADHLRVLDCALLDGSGTSTPLGTVEAYDTFLQIYRTGAAPSGQPETGVPAAPGAEAGPVSPAETDGVLPLNQELAGKLPKAMEEAMRRTELDGGFAQYYAPGDPGKLLDLVENITAEHGGEPLYYLLDKSASPSAPTGNTYEPDMWNAYPAERINHLMKEIFGLDITKDMDSWLNDDRYNPVYYSDTRRFIRDGDNYILYVGGRGDSFISEYKIASAVQETPGRFSVLFTYLPNDDGFQRDPLRLTMQNTGTEAEPYFQIVLPN